ncbi:hypothetical protein B4Q13_24750, partial [Lacticaseibacillus rhamnosus]
RPALAGRAEDALKTTLRAWPALADGYAAGKAGIVAPQYCRGRAWPQGGRERPPEGTLQERAG